MTTSRLNVDGEAVLRKIKLRIMPLLVVLYIIAFIDRANVGFAALDMNADLNINAWQFGLAAGLFSVGYFLFEVPSNLLMRKVGARRWIARILVSWGVVAVVTGFIQDWVQLATLRFILGIAEAGFFPCVILYLTYWFPQRERARVVALFMIALPIATLIASPLSGLIMDNISWFGLEGWRWVFILEGFPAIALAAVVLFVLVDGPQSAKWLSSDEKQWLSALLEEERAATAAKHKVGFWQSLAGARVLMLAFVYYSKSVAIYVLAFFTPTIVAGLAENLSSTQVGLVTAVPYGIAAVAMVWWARHSDKTMERRWHMAIPLLACAAGLIAMPMVGDNLIASLLLLVLVTAAVYCTYGPFWSLPSLFLTDRAAAVGLASINSIANLGGFVGPFGFGALEEATGNNTIGLIAVAIVLVIAAGFVVSLRFVKTAEHDAREIEFARRADFSRQLS